MGKHVLCFEMSGAVSIGTLLISNGDKVGSLVYCSRARSSPTIDTPNPVRHLIIISHVSRDLTR